MKTTFDNAHDFIDALIAWGMEGKKICARRSKNAALPFAERFSEWARRVKLTGWHASDSAHMDAATPWLLSVVWSEFTLLGWKDAADTLEDALSRHIEKVACDAYDRAVGRSQEGGSK